MTRYGVKTLTWGRLHWYAIAWREDDGRHSEEWQVHRILSARDSARLNEIDGAVMGLTCYRPGDETNRFDTKFDALEAGAQLLRDKFGEDIEVEDGACYYLSNPIHPKPVLGSGNNWEKDS